MVQEILLVVSIIIAAGYLFFRFRPSPRKDSCAGDCGCSVKSEIKQKS